MPGVGLICTNPVLAMIGCIMLIAMTVSNDVEKKTVNVEGGYLQLFAILTRTLFIEIGEIAINVWTIIYPYVKMILPYLGNLISAFMGGCVSYAIQSRNIEEKIDRSIKENRKIVIDQLKQLKEVFNFKSL